MSSYLSNLLTHTTSRYNSLRRTILHDEDDGDTEDDSHICRVLRAYYLEHSRPRPSWLPPDPHDRSAITSTPSLSAPAPNRPSYGPSSRAGSTRSNLSDLWDDAPAPQHQAPSSLRAAARRPGAPPPSTGRQSPHLAVPAPRPLPSQREGSYQGLAPQHSASGRPGGPSRTNTPPIGGVGAGSAQDRLKARLWGGPRSNTPPGGFDASPPPSSHASDGGGASSRRFGRIT